LIVDTQLAAAAVAAAWSRVSHQTRAICNDHNPRHREMIVIAAVGFYEHRKKSVYVESAVFGSL
jgi:L-fucose mutarotase/ribose pyranase (RbsD/FucU family)